MSAAVRWRWAGLQGGLLAALGTTAMAAPPLQTEAPAAQAESSARQAAVALGLPLPAPALGPAATGGGHLTLHVERRRPAAAPAGLRLITVPASKAAAAPSAELRSLIDDVARTYGHDARLLHAIIHVESRFNPNAVSPKGAIGLMQVMPATAERVGVQEPQRALFDPETNLHAGARYLRLLMDMFSDRPDLAVAAYNAGEGAVLRYQREVPPFRETQAYVREVMARYLAPHNKH